MARPREPWNIRPARKSRPVTASLKAEVETKDECMKSIQDDSWFVP